MTFKDIGIGTELLQGIKELGFDRPTPIQEAVIPALLEKRNDVIGLAQTGTGKTAAFGLPILQEIDKDYRKTQAVILAPTRELCIQITKDIQAYARYLKGLNIVPVYGGADIVKQMKDLRKGAHIVVATPGRLNDIINRRRRMDVSDVGVLVLDEADEMLTMGFKEELDAIFDQMPPTKTTLLFSATMTNDLRRISKNYMHKPIEISVGQQNMGADHVSHICYQVHEKNRYAALKRIVDNNPNIYGIIFCRTREETKQVAQKLMHDGYNADALHGDLSQAQREHVMEKFRIRNLNLLTATDVAARGIDVKDLTHIINYNLPDEPILYIHRSGRTGRAGQTGIAIAITNLREKRKIAIIEKMLKKKFEIKPVPTGRQICENQLLNIVERLENTDIDHAEIDSYLPLVYDKLESLSREELIKHFVGFEFNHFLKYYKNLEDLTKPLSSKKLLKSNAGQTRRNDRQATPNDRQTKQNDRQPKRNDRQPRQRQRRETMNPIAENGFTRFFINLGERESISPPELIGLVVRSTRNRSVNVGKIAIMRKFSFFEVDEQYTQTVLAGFSDMTFKRRKIVVEISQAN